MPYSPIPDLLVPALCVLFNINVLASVKGERDSGRGVDEVEDDTLSVIDTSNWAPGCFISRAQSQRAGN